jgi:DNA modification methylase
MTIPLLPAVASGQSTLDVIHNCDAMTLLKALPDESVNCIVTSPPYYQLRSYLPNSHENKAKEIGLENTLQDYLVRLVGVFHEAKRVLRNDGTVWINMGDSFSDKQLLGVPWRLAFALQDDGYYLRQDLIWHKPNPLPESVTDRCTKAHEYVFLLSKSPRYWYDADAIREPNTNGTIQRLNSGPVQSIAENPKTQHYRVDGRKDGYTEAAGRNKRSVWTVATEATPFAHFATFPQALITPMIQAGCPAQVCSVCSAPYERVTEQGQPVNQSWSPGTRTAHISAKGKHGSTSVFSTDVIYQKVTLGFRPTCDHTDAPSRPGIVLDMFGGSGTTGLVAMRLGRHYIMSDLSSEYVAIARQRLATADPFQDTPISATGETQLSLFEATT